MLASRASLLHPRTPLPAAFQLERACTLQRLLERQELLVFGGNVAGAKPVPMALPSVVFVRCVWSGGNVRLSASAFAPHYPLCFAFQLEGACTHQRLLERQELFACTRTVACPCHCARRICLDRRKRQQATLLPH